MAHRAKVLAVKKAHSPSALPQARVATSDWFSRPVRAITESGTMLSRTKVVSIPVITAFGRRSGAWLKPRAISGTMYWAEKQNTAMLNTGTM